MKIGDIVSRNSYNNDIIFKIESFTADKNGKVMAILKGVAFRIIADAYIDDLKSAIVPSNIRSVMIGEKVENKLSNTRAETLNKQKNMCRSLTKGKTTIKSYGMPGKVLQLDGDKDYLNICLDVYSELGIPAAGVAIKESDQHKEVYKLLKKYNPDILVITGHDSMTIKEGNIDDLKNYRNSLNFIKTVKEARRWEPNLDDLVIFAGACQSDYEKIILSGANFASSPGRIMIHALDPVFIVEKIACSRIDTVVPIEEIIKQTVTGVRGIGGCETRGKFRWAMPKFSIENTIEENIKDEEKSS
ncbi:MAG: sporulation peptidase YabG [Clostridioides sp.]|jgi:spore coat assembly protein|nr:sporulation peptidase YabG [Clostridioides sp.]